MLFDSLLVSRELALPSFCPGGLSGVGNLNYPFIQSLPGMHISFAVVSLMHLPCSPLADSTKFSVLPFQRLLISPRDGIRLGERKAIALLPVPQLPLKII